MYSLVIPSALSCKCRGGGCARFGAVLQGPLPKLLGHRRLVKTKSSRSKGQGQAKENKTGEEEAKTSPRPRSNKATKNKNGEEDAKTSPRPRSNLKRKPSPV